MNVAVSGDRGCCLTRQLGPGIYLFAVANGFGTIDGEPIAPCALRRLRGEFERRVRPKRIAGALAAAMTRVNTALHLRSASHEDYVTAGCSLTAVLVVADRAYLAHVGSTGAYLSRDGCIVGLTKSDTFDGEKRPILMRALGAQSSVEISACNFALNDGDALLLTGHPLREGEDRRRLAESLIGATQSFASGEQFLIVRYEAADAAERAETARTRPVPRMALGVIATILFYALLCIG